MTRSLVLAAAISLALGACNNKAPEATPAATNGAAAAKPASDNPLLSPSTLPFQAPPFDKIIGIGPLFHLGDDMAADIQRIRTWYLPWQGKNHGIV